MSRLKPFITDKSIAEVGGSDPHEEISVVEIREHLDAVLQSKPFLSSRRCSEFLRYVVDRALEQDDAHLREGAIAQSVFGRTSVAEGRDDSVVRVCAREVRKRLERYYSEDGNSDSVRVQLPVGTYGPLFQRHLKPPTPVPELPRLGAVNNEGLRAPVAWRKIVVYCCVLLLSGGTVAVGERYFRDGRRFREFWAPFNKQGRPVLVCVGAQMVWGLSRRLDEEFLRKNPAELDVGRALYRFLPGSKIAAEDLVPFTDDRFTSGDMQAAISITQLMDRSGKPCQFRLGGGISEEESRKQPIILVGAFSNPWTLEYGRNLRFYFDRAIDKDGVHVSIRDRKDPHNAWSVPYLARDRTTVDYAIISRVVDPVTRNALIAIAGISHYGTQAAAEFVTDQNSLDVALRHAPAGWMDRNFEAVVETAVISRIPTRTRIVMSAVW